MELASMLAGEQFSHHPQAVCPVIGNFLRAYNDCVDDRRRQDLYAYAARVVGTRSTAAVERKRADMCREWVRQVQGDGGTCERASRSTFLPGWLRRWLVSARCEFEGRHAGMVFGRSQVGYSGVAKPNYARHRAALRLLDELIAVGSYDEPRLDGLDTTAGEQRPAAAG